MRLVRIKDLKKGEYFTLLQDAKTNENGEILSKYVRVRGEYIRSEKMYSTHKFDDICAERLMKGNRFVYTDFIF